MVATARHYPEGALMYLIEQTDLYLRVRNGVRQVNVSTPSLPLSWLTLSLSVLLYPG